MVRVDSSNNVGAYVHGGRIGVLVEVRGGSADLARGIAMHVAAMNPPYISEKYVPADFIAKEKEIELAKMTDKDKAKPAEILEKIIGGKVAKIINENTLTGQPYVLDTNESVGNVLKKEGRGSAFDAPACGRRRHREAARRRRLPYRSAEAGGSRLSAHAVVPAQAGTHFDSASRSGKPKWIPAFAGMTG